MIAYGAALGLLLATPLSGRGSAADLLMRNARLVDGTGASPREGVSILIREGRIAQLGTDVSAEGVPVLDVSGASVLPGLIDAHVHLSWGPGSGLREDSPNDWGRFRAHYLRAYLACGVTTVLDAAAMPGAVRDIQSWLAAGHPGPRYLTLGPLLRPPGGYPSGYPEGMWEPVSSAEEVEARLEELQPLGAAGVKVTIERGWLPLRDLPIHPPAMREAIRRGAAKRELPIYVHATSEADQAIGLEMGAHALVHPIQYRRQDLSDAFVARMVESSAYQMTTFSVMDSPLALYHPERLDDPLVQLVVPGEELAAARDSRNGRAALRSMIRDEGPPMPDLLRDLVARFWFGEAMQLRALQHSQRAVLRLHRAGVRVVVGSDAPFRPSALYAFHGPTTLREIELLGVAGLSPAEALAAATRVPAEMLGLGDEIGTVEVGKRADLVVVRGDPLRDPRALRTVEWTVRDGVARTPAEWIAP
jgi:cytosine/adenosine deaminase-related metal-dependent hydrolase